MYDETLSGDGERVGEREPGDAEGERDADNASEEERISGEAGDGDLANKSRTRACWSSSSEDDVSSIRSADLYTLDGAIFRLLASAKTL